MSLMPRLGLDKREDMKASVASVVADKSNYRADFYVGHVLPPAAAKIAEQFLIAQCKALASHRLW